MSCGKRHPGKVCNGQDRSHWSSNFTDTISIRVKDKYFNVPRDLLVANSTFFDDALSHSEPKKFFLVLDDIDADLFNLFVNVLLESSFSTKYRIPEGRGPFCGLTCASLLRLWKLSHRFNNQKIRLLVEEALKTEWFQRLTPKNWEVIYVDGTEAWVREVVLGLQRCYTICKKESIPFEKELVLMCANCPGQVVAAHFEYLEPDFKTEVVKSFATRVADPQVVKRKRDHEDEGKSNDPKKRRC